MKEIWKPIKKYKNKFFVSNFGRVKSMYKGKILTPQLSRNKYLSFCLKNKNKVKRFYAHDLVASNFIGKRPKGYQINHKDGNKINNYYKNLEYLTCSDNHKHAFRKGLMNKKGEHHHLVKLNNKKVLEIRKLFNKGIRQVDLKNMFNVTHSNIYAIIKRNNWKHI